ncbi:MAG: hypothetical protein WC796_01410 [Candidatus Pacearchaeota archaeon]|jgi:hypothetical protein
MISRSAYYGNLAMRDVRQAYSEISPEIVQAQETLRRVCPDSILLSLVTVNEDRVRFAPKFGDHLARWTGKKRKNMGNWYSALGYYIDILAQEAAHCSN